MNLNERFMEFALLGSEWVMWVLVALSVVGATVAAERFLHFRRAAKSAGPLLDAVLSVWARRGEDGAPARLRSLQVQARALPSPAGRVLNRTLEAAGRGGEAIESIYSAAKTSEKLRLERYLNILGTVGANAPFIGLFGTVLEILRVFNAIGADGLSAGDGTAAIMSGISEALVATAIGLLVAIPTVVAYNAFVRWMDSILGTAEEISLVARAIASGEEPIDGR